MVVLLSILSNLIRPLVRRWHYVHTGIKPYYKIFTVERVDIKQLNKFLA